VTPRTAHSDAPAPPGAVSPRGLALVGALAGLLLVGMLAVLVAVLASLEGTRSELRTTRKGVIAAERRSAHLDRQIQPLLQTTGALTSAPNQRRLRQTGQQLSAAAGQVPPLADDAHRGVDIAGFIAGTLRAADLGSATVAVRTLADAAVPAARQLLPVTDHLLPSIETVQDLLRAQLDANRKTLSTQRLTLGHTQRIEALFDQSLTIQREILERTRSLDRKTGGTAPPTPVTP
jgi:hypothetical protein